MRRYILLLFLAAAALLLQGCASRQEKDGKINVVLEECQDVITDRQSARIKRGSDVSFVLNLKNGCTVSGADYGDYEISTEGTRTVLTLKDVCYSTVVKLDTAYEYRIYYPNGGNGEPVKVPDVEHVKNTRTEPFVREGYQQTGWNTQADGSGEHIGFGSRTDCDELYAEWAEETEESEFSYICTEESAAVTGYHGTDNICVLPDTLGGKEVRVIKDGAFAGADFREFICSDTVQTIESGAFRDAAVEKITLYDSLLRISDDSFAGCPVRTLHLNARRAPVYAGSYFSAFPDKCERLFSIQGKKIVLFSGSSGRYGYDSGKIEDAFAGYEVVNMGTYAYTNAGPQLDIVLQAVGEGDILVEAPEFDAAEQQFCGSDEFDRFFYSLTETDYDLVSLVDLREYENVFDALNEYLYEHSRMEAKDYSCLAWQYDDDGNRVDEPTYNQYGDYTLDRPNSERDEMHRPIPADYTTETVTKERIEALDRKMELFTQKGTDVLFTYAPRNRSSLTEESTPENIHKMEKLLKDTLVIPVISDIDDYFYSGIYFYEIDNHLSSEGAGMRTDQVIQDMKKWMEKKDG